MRLQLDIPHSLSGQHVPQLVRTKDGRPRAVPDPKQVSEGNIIIEYLRGAVADQGWKYVPRQSPDHPEQVVRLHILQHRVRPTGWSPKKQEALVYKRCTKTPDGSNLLKQVEDAAKGIVFEDDCQVECVGIVRIWGRREMTILTFESECYPPVMWGKKSRGGKGNP
jgi:hypothetical protein